MTLGDLDLNVPVAAPELQAQLPRCASHEHFKYFGMQQGEHYALLRHLANQYKKAVIVDVGTHIGLSALALSDSDNTVVSLDIEDKRIIPLPDNVQCKIGNMVHDEKLFPLDASLAVLDIDPHAGEEEWAIVEQLIRRNWRGVMVCDDIHLNSGMEAFWKAVCSCDRLETLDVTDVGHCTGTGLIYFHSHPFQTL